MKDLEKLVKNSFDSFEPEVSSDVWQKLEQGLNNLPSSSSSVSGNGSTAVKGLAIKGSTMAWVAGAIITAAITASIVFSGNNSEDKKAIENISENIPAETISVPANDINSTVAETVQSENIEKNIIDNRSVSLRPVITSATKENSQIQREVAHSKGEAANEKSSVPQNEVTDNRQDQVSGSHSENPKNAVVAPHNGETAAPSHQNDNSRKNTESDLKIIYSGSCGFAPFKVALILNDVNEKGNWDFGDGNATQSMNTTSHIFKNKGTYVITCKTEHAELTHTVEVIGTLSNTFTPNGDGQNDEFYVDAPLKELSLKVFNRSGKLEYEMKQPGEHWDGKNENGEDLPSGTYFYDIFARSVNEQAITQKGTINILR